MKRRWHVLTGVVFAVAALLALPAAASAQVQLKVMVSGGFIAAYKEVLPEFERTAGVEVVTLTGISQGSGPDTVAAQLGRGVPVDLVIMAKEGLVDLMADGKIAAGTNVDLAKTPVGLAVRAGAPKPNIGTVDAFKQALLHAKSVDIPTSTVGIYLTNKLYPQMGIAEAMARKTTTSRAADLSAGTWELAIRAVSELLHVPGTDFVGNIPPELQYTSVFSAAVVKGSKEPDVAKRLIAFLSSEKATAAIRHSGMEQLALR